jgi:FLVCR family feline leukemia virus subgroup C receptor-related protein
MIFPASNDGPISTTIPTTTRIYKVYPRRFAILAIFCICSLSSGFQWIEYVIIQNIIVRYYNQSLPGSYDEKNNAVTWTSLSYMVILIYIY